MADIVQFYSRKSHGPGILSRLFSTLRRWAQRIEERNQLARLDWRDLKDMGISRAARDDELRKPFWRD